MSTGFFLVLVFPSSLMLFFEDVLASFLGGYKKEKTPKFEGQWLLCPSYFVLSRLQLQNGNKKARYSTLLAAIYLFCSRMFARENFCTCHG